MLKNIIVIIGVPLLIIVVTFILFNKQSSYNAYKCETKALAVKGIVVNTFGRSSYMKAQVDNIKKPFSFNIARIKYRKGFPEYYSYEIGDSIIKEADSKEITVKRGDSIAIYILDCDD
jgi:hypothetical protein